MDIPCSSEYEPLQRTGPFVYRTYKTRWIVVLMLALINGTNAFLWITYCPIANYFLEYYETSELVLNMITLIFPFVTVVLGFVVVFTMDRTGIRSKLLFSCTMNLICGGLRALSNIGHMHATSGARLLLVVLGQFVASAAQPFCLFSTTKLAFDWFPDNQRAIANTIGSLGNSVGVLLGSALIPVFIKSASSIPSLNYFTFGITVLGFILTLVFVRRSKPPTPPSFASELSVVAHRTIHHPRLFSVEAVTNFGRNLFQPFKLSGFWIVFLNFGLAVAYFSMLSALFEQILCSKGYSNQFAGFCASAMIAAGVIISGPLALIVDKTGLLLEIVKTGCALSALGAVVLSVAIWFSNQRTFVALMVMWIGAFGFSQYSLVLELVAEATFPLPEYVSSALLIIGSQVLSIIVIPLMQSSAPILKASNYTEFCGVASSPQDYSIPHMILCAIMGVLAVLQLFCMRLPYKRRNIASSIIIPISNESAVEEYVA